jgi:hypothetical protein
MPAGETTNFVFTLSANGAGTVAFNVTADGFGINSVAVPQAVSTSGDTVTIVNPAVLAAQAKPLSSTVSVGQQFEVHVTVTNTATAPGAIANNVNLGNFDSVPAGLFTVVSGPAPVSATLTAAGAQTFVYVVQAAATGTAQVQATATAWDSNSGVTKTANATASGSVLIKAVPQLTVTLNQTGNLAIPANTSVTLTATVVNTSALAATVNNLTATVSSATAELVLVSSSPVPSPLAGGASPAITMSGSGSVN